MHEINPCDWVQIPVFATYSGEKGVRADREMFAEFSVIVLRWAEAGRMRQTLVFRPYRWYDGKNYYDESEGKWYYG